jgi:hypothetical protein
VREEEELGRLQRAVARLIEAQQEALDATDQALELGEADPEDDVQLLDASQRLEGVLVDVRAILEGASDDVREILGDDVGAAYE